MIKSRSKLSLQMLTLHNLTKPQQKHATTKTHEL